MKILKGNKGINRIDMPQLKGFPIEGSEASKLKTSKSGKVDVTEAFLGHLCFAGIKMKHDFINPKKLKPTQNQLLVERIEDRLPELLADANHKKFTMPYIVSKDGYLLDGHHGWATVLTCIKLQQRKVKIRIIKVDLSIEELLKVALTFTNKIGVAAKLA